MLAADEKQTALQTIQAVVTAIAQNHYAAIPTLLSRSDLPMEELQGEIERVLRFQKTTVAPKRSLISMKTRTERDLKLIIG